MNATTHTIAAISTPPGKGGVAVIRASGDGALEIAERVFSPASGKRICDYPPRTQIYGYMKDGDEAIDDGLLTYFPAGGSYTGEETVEISCHGGVLVSHAVLGLLLSAGAVHAEAGEFTRRAFVNGRLSLTEAEAIGQLLEARSEHQMRLTSTTSRELLTEKVSALRGALVSLMSSIYARIDYPDEDLGDFSDTELLERLRAILSEMDALIATYPTGKAISEGISTVICGKPNAGKSSLYNLLLGDEKAIVTEVEGTTRDVLESVAQMGKVMLKISDTAGIRSGDNIDTVERIGIEKSRKLIANCELIFAIFDVSRPFDEKDAELIEEIKPSSAIKIAVLNKTDSRQGDLSLPEGVFEEILSVSVKESPEQTLGALSDTVNRLFTDERLTVGQTPMLYSTRQLSAMKRARELVSVAVEALGAGFAQDAVSGDVERAIDAISELDGRAVHEDVVADIFSKFCVGK